MNLNKKSRCRMVFASFIADALAMGTHWIYHTDIIAERFGRIEGYIEPPEGSYHAGKSAGDFTHYGDQALVLLESLAACGRFDANDFSKRWQRLFENYHGYIDGATRQTLQNLSEGKDNLRAGSASNDLAGASRIAPVVYAYRSDEDAMVYAARTQTKMTHSHPWVIDAAEFFSRVTFRVLRGENPANVAKDLARGRFHGSPIHGWVEAGVRSVRESTVDVIKSFGQSCHIPEAFPAVIHLLGKYENTLENALIENVMAGGDSAARGMIVGMVLGASGTVKNLPEHWLEGLNARGKIGNLMKKIEGKTTE